MPAAPAATSLADADYHAKAHAVLDAIEAQADAWLDADVVDIDSHRTGGLLELSFPNGSKIILNTQPPLQEIWLAAKTGGYHFRFVDGLWRVGRARALDEQGRVPRAAVHQCQRAGRRYADIQRLNKSRMLFFSSSEAECGTLALSLLKALTPELLVYSS